MAFIGSHPDAPELAETFNLWMDDGARETCVNFSPQMKGGEIRMSASVFLPGGRILRRNTGDAAHYGDPRRFGNEFVTYECVEPFRKWTYRLDNVPMLDTSHAEHARGPMTVTEPSVTVSAEIHLTTRSPAWIMGSLRADAREKLDGQAGLWTGCRLASGPSPLTRRYEQLAEAEGVITVDGQDYPFKGTGMRAHVRGYRELTGMPGHFWGAALFPSGKGFGYVGYQHADGRVDYEEAMLFVGGQIHPARVVSAPLMDREPTSRPFAYEFEAEAFGQVRISGEDQASYVWSQAGWVGMGSDEMKPVYGLVPDAPLVMKQSSAAYHWDGETGYGMREISGTLR